MRKRTTEAPILEQPALRCFDTFRIASVFFSASLADAEPSPCVNFSRNSDCRGVELSFQAAPHGGQPVSRIMV
jgi:hypothetical protein